MRLCRHQLWPPRDPHECAAVAYRRSSRPFDEGSDHAAPYEGMIPLSDPSPTLGASQGKTGLRLPEPSPRLLRRILLPVSVSQRELMARNAEDLAVRQVVRPASRDRRPVVCMPAAVPSEGVRAATAVMGCRCAGVLTIALTPTARSAIGLILHRFRESHTSPPPMAAPGPRAGFPIELRYAALGNGSAVCHRGDRDYFHETVPVAPL